MKLLSFSNEVSQALKDKAPVILFDASITPCGMPYKETMAMVIMLETLARNLGVIPAAVAITGGKIHIGASHATLEHIARQESCLSATYSDLAYVISTQLTVKTTTTASMYAAYLAQLPIVITSGLGGIYPNKHENNRDGLSNLHAFSVLPITVICSGAQSILDLPHTIIRLEKQGVPIVGYKTKEFPACYNHSSGIMIKHQLNTPKEIASLIHTQRELLLQSSIVITNPIPKNAEIMDSEMPSLVKQAQQETSLTNKKVITPALLNRLTELTTAQHLHAHIEVMKNNVALGAEIAAHLF